MPDNPCGRLTMIPMGPHRPKPGACQLEHGHAGAHEAKIGDMFGLWLWHDHSPSDNGPSLADQILGSVS